MEPLYIIVVGVFNEYSEQILSNFRIDKTYIGVESINIEYNSVYTAILQETDIDKLIMKHSKENYIVCLQNKFFITKLYKWTNLTDFDGVVSNHQTTQTNTRFPQDFFVYVNTKLYK